MWWYIRVWQHCAAAALHSFLLPWLFFHQAHTLRREHKIQRVHSSAACMIASHSLAHCCCLFVIYFYTCSYLATLHYYYYVSCARGTHSARLIPVGQAGGRFIAFNVDFLNDDLIFIGRDNTRSVRLFALLPLFFLPHHTPQSCFI